ncbi:MAG: class I SAM-dependent methyltransferase [Thermoplasmata archaeon]
MPYDPTIYAGSARHYRPGRPPYSPDLEETLTAAAGLDGRGRLLDVGCGPGLLAVRLASLFEAVVALEPDADMLEEAGRFAAETGVDNVALVRGLAEELPGAAPGPFRLVTFGQSFHWTDERRVAEAVFDMLEPGGAMAMVAPTVEGRPKPPNPGYPPVPHDALRALVAEYLGTRPRSGQGFVTPRDHRFEDVLVLTRFGAPEQLYAPGIPDLLRDSESVLSGYFSLTTSAPHLFADRLDEFSGRFRALLQAVSPEGLFWDWPGDTEILLARKSPAAGDARAAREPG